MEIRFAVIEKDTGEVVISDRAYISNIKEGQSFSNVEIGRLARNRQLEPKAYVLELYES